MQNSKSHQSFKKFIYSSYRAHLWLYPNLNTRTSMLLFTHVVYCSLLVFFFSSQMAKKKIIIKSPYRTGASACPHFFISACPEQCALCRKQFTMRVWHGLVVVFALLIFVADSLSLPSLPFVVYLLGGTFSKVTPTVLHVRIVRVCVRPDEHTQRTSVYGALWSWFTTKEIASINFNISIGFLLNHGACDSMAAPSKGTHSQDGDGLLMVSMDECTNYRCDVFV